MKNTISYLAFILVFTSIPFVTYAEVKMVSANGFKISNSVETSASTSATEHMRIVFVDPEKTLRMVGGLGPLQGMGLYGALNWTITSTERGTTEVTLNYNVTGINENGFAQLSTIVDQVQAIQLGSLKAYLEQP